MTSPPNAPAAELPRRPRRRFWVIIIMIIITPIALFIAVLRHFSLAFVDVSRFPYMDPSVPLVGESIIPPPGWKPVHTSWYDACLAHMRENPTNSDGLRYHAEAVEAFTQYNASPAAKRGPKYAIGYLPEELRNYEKLGASALTPELRTTLTNIAPILTEAFAAGALAPYTLPENEGDNGPVPASLLDTTLIHLMVVQSDETARTGDPNLALRQAIGAYGFAASYYSAKSNPYTYHSGYRGMKISDRAVQQHLRHPAITTETATFAAVSLKRFDSKRGTAVDIIREIGRNHIGEIRSLQSDMNAHLNKFTWRKITQTERWITRWYLVTMPRRATFEAHCDRFFRQYAQDISRSTYQRQFRTQPFDPFVHRKELMYLRLFNFPNIWEVIVNDDITRARNHTLQALALLIANRPTEAAALRDPFRDAPLTITTATIHSVGPDFTDDRAAITYDPTNGTISSGDVILRR